MNKGGVDATRLVGNLYYMKLEDAQTLCRNDPNDFYTFAGFCSWRPGQLEREMGEERNEWKVLSVDEQTIWNELKLQSSKSTIQIGSNDSLLEAGTDMWRNYLNKVDISESKATERLPSGQLHFYDEMLKVWAEDNLNVNLKETTTRSTKEVTADSSEKIKPGTLVRATSPPSNDMLLFEAELIRSLILVLEDTPESTVGIVLNHVMPAAIDVKEGEEPIPLRFGGPIDVPSWRYRSYHAFEGNQDEQVDESEDEIYEGFLNYQQSESIDDIIFDDVYNDEEVYDDDSSFIWIHRDAALGANRNGNGGSKLGMADIWLINEDDALNAIQSGALSLKDVVLFAGVCIWEKGQGLGKVGGGLREQIDVMQSLEVVDQQSESNDDVVEAVWNILSQKQRILAKETLDSNVDATIAAWEASCSNKSNNQQAPDNDRLSRIQLADAALKAWIGRSLLDDPLGTLVEVKKRTI